MTAVLTENYEEKFKRSWPWFDLDLDMSSSNEEEVVQ